MSASGFSPSRAGLNSEWDILIQSGHLSAAYGKDKPAYETSRKRWVTHVGFDDASPGSPRGLSFGDPGSRYRSGSVSLSSLLSWILDGTSRMVGRPIIINGFAEAHPELTAMLTRRGLKLLSRSGLPRTRPVSRGRRSTPLKAAA